MTVGINKKKLLVKTITYLLTFFASLKLTYSQVEQNSHPLDEKYEQCCNNHHGDFGSLNCANEFTTKWNKELEKFYWGLMNILDSLGQNDLRLAQEQWLEYRDLELKFSSGLYDLEGTMYSRMRAQRIMNITKRRALDLKSYYWVRTEEDDPLVKEQDSSTTHSILHKENISLKLPTPDTQFFSGLEKDKRNNAQYVIEKYIETYLAVTKEQKVIGKAPLYNTEIPGENCLFRTEYGNIAFIEDYGCDSYFQTTTIEFSNYSFDEVIEIIKILLPKVQNESDDDNYSLERTGWNESKSYYEYNSNCTLEIHKEENKIIVSYGCSC